MTAIEGTHSGMLGDVRVLDLAEGGAGSQTAAMLGDYGAEVLKVVADDPRQTRSPTLPDWLVRNRSKTLLLADVASARDWAEVGRLARSADVVIADTPERLAAFGLDADTLAQERLVVMTPPYLSDGAPWFGAAESAELLAAITAVSAYQASYSGAPVAAVYPYLVLVHGVWAAVCTVAALVEQRYTRRGQLVTVSGFHAAATFGDPIMTLPEDEADPDRGIGPAGLNPMYTRYEGSDGEWVFVGGLGPKFANLVIDTLGLRDLLDDPRIDGRIERLWLIQNSRWVLDAFAERFRTRPAGEWVHLLESNDVPAVIVARREDWFRSEQVMRTDQHLVISDPVLGDLAMTGASISSSVAPAVVAAASLLVPVNQARWRTSAGIPVAAPPPSRNGQGPLAGFRAAVLGTFVAGPYVGRLLAELGAEVIKVEPPSGDPWRLQGFSLNRGYRAIAINLATPAGISALKRILVSCDLVVDNFRLGVTDRLKISQDHLAELRLDAISVAVTAYGERGPLARKPGYDTVVQAAAGQMRAQGGDDEPVPYSLPPNDMTTAVCGALAAVLGIYHRVMTGAGQHLSTSLTAGAALLQSGDLVSYAGRPAGRMGGRDFPGPGPTDRFYRVSDGYVRIEAAELEPSRWRVAGIDLRDEALEIDPAAEIGQALARYTRAEALARLTAASVPAAPFRRSSELTRDSELHAAGLLGRFTAFDGRRFVTNNRLADFSRTKVNTYFTAPGLGEHSVELLREAGATDDETAALVRDGVVIDGDPMEITYMPPYR